MKLFKNKNNRKLDLVGIIGTSSPIGSPVNTLDLAAGLEIAGKGGRPLLGQGAPCELF